VRGVRLSLPTPYDMPWMTWYLSAHAVPGVESYENGRYACAVRSAEGPDVVSLDFGARPGSVVVTSLCSGRPEQGLIARIRALLDLDTDATEIAAHLSADPALAPAVAVAPGIRVPGALDGWQLLLQTMVGQQISLAAARTHLTRLIAALGEPVTGLDGWRLIPSAAVVAERGRTVLTGPRRRVEAVVAAAAGVADGSLDLSPDRDASSLRADLLALRGVGPWTAAYAAMRLGRDPDVLLATDLVVRQGATVLGVDLDAAGQWAPYRSYATMHLWRAALAARPTHIWPFSNDSVSEGTPAQTAGPDMGGGT
jgi:AraC family transcriptional regulator, regulatory protein of adaptative response / DNA-3-methyladenine glycosylase II